MTYMNKQALSDWVQNELDRGMSMRALARELGFEDTSVRAWHTQGVKKQLKPRAIAAIAAYKGATLQSTYEWLGIPAPKNATNESRIEALEARVEELGELLESVLGQLLAKGIQPSPLALSLQDELHLGGYDIVRDRLAYDQLRKEALEALQQDALGAQKVVAQVLGAIEIKVDDYTYIALVFRRVLGSKWTTGYIEELSKLADKQYG